MQTRYVWPAFQEEVLEDHGTWELLRNHSGAVVRRMKQGNMIPSFVRGAVETREDWERIKDRFRPVLEGRAPADWDKKVAEWRTRDYPLGGVQSEPWLNLVERWFGELTTKWIRRGTHRSVKELIASIRTWIASWNEHPRPYVWHKTADQILDGLASYCQRINNSGH